MNNQFSDAPEGKDSFDNLLILCEENAKEYRDRYSYSERKKNAQFFTPIKMAEYMSSMITIMNKKDIRILDPGAGIGILTCSLCNHLINKNINSIEIVLYELDKNLIFYLKDIMKRSKIIMDNYVNDYKYTIKNHDYILNPPSIKEKFDVVISNPPYYKVKKDHEYIKKNDSLMYGQPNILSFFIALSIKNLSMHGQMVFITPRNFCSGKSFNKIRNLYLKNMRINKIHLFKSRKNLFSEGKILQENVIIHSIKNNNENNYVIISHSNGIDFKNNIINLNYKDVIYYTNNNTYIRIPITKKDLKIINKLDKWNNTFKDNDLCISTGPIVDFRNRDYIIKTLDGKNSAPLIWINNFNGHKIIFPIENSKPQAIEINKKTENYLLENKNYVLLKRISSKEQKKRLHAAIFIKGQVRSNKIGIDNKVNYIYKKHGDLNLEETYGITSFLNSNVCDKFFRTINGNTQVNATDIEILPFPNINVLKEIGKYILEKDNVNLESILNDVLIASELLTEDMV